MIAFLIPIKHPQTAKSWPEVCRLFERCLRSVCGQTSQDFRVLVVCNERPAISFNHPNVEFLEVDLPVPARDRRSRQIDKKKKLIMGLVWLRRWEPTHVMSVDADDCISRQIVAYAGQRSGNNGWYLDSGYEYDDGSTHIQLRRRRFYALCGTCNIIKYQLYNLPETSLPFRPFDSYDRFVGGHGVAKIDLAERGAPLEPLPFPGAIYIRDRGGESNRMQEPLVARLKRSPRHALHGVKKCLAAPFTRRWLSLELQQEFGLYQLEQSTQQVYNAEQLQSALSH
jgi:hypothetical protein